MCNIFDMFYYRDTKFHIVIWYKVFISWYTNYVLNIQINCIINTSHVINVTVSLQILLLSFLHCKSLASVELVYVYRDIYHIMI